jgi:hypothetical protein
MIVGPVTVRSENIWELGMPSNQHTVGMLPKTSHLKSNSVEAIL